MPVFLSAFAAISREDLGERTRPEVKISLYSQASGAANRLHFGEAEIAPFLLETNDVSEEYEVVATWSAFGSEPRPV